MGDLDARLDIKDVERWVEELEKNGFVCLQGVLNIHEIQHTRNLFWDWLESLGSGISRDDSTTWKDENWPGDFKTGIITSNGGAHSQAMWYIRSLDQVKEIFSSIWGSQELITSFEAPVVWRPWSSEVSSSGWKPETEGLHLNQNPTKKLEYRTIQGSIPLYDVTEETGGLEFVLESHKDEITEQISKTYPFFKHLNNFCQVRYDDFKEEVKLAKCLAGDLILWDSRCILGDRVGSADMQASSLLIRCPVTMLPRVGVPNPVIKLRNTALRDGLSLSNEFRVFSLHNTGGFNIIKPFIQPTLSDKQKELI